tara:strand:- start:332 stop:583 length:252 start_codon:yes stop_codon:yes gene_type:complete
MSNKIYWIELRENRDRKLQASDWTQLPDSPLTEEKKTEWADYRTALRNVPNNLRDHANYISDEESYPFDDSIMSWSFPTKPSD